ncbi:hypothetical protein F5Y04DRAFT_22615 [Hypomontagnella monticulosa]|nr:hypothetical protein F5Y04DRAFT_22615 [Hypomontagnella monticulosa]
MSEETAAQAAVAQGPETSSAPAVDGTASDSVAPTSDAKPIEKESASTTEAAQSKDEKEDSAAEKSTKAEEPATASAEVDSASAPADDKPTETDVETTDKPADEADADAKVEQEEAADTSNIEHNTAAGTAEGTSAEAESAAQGDKSKGRRKSAGSAMAKKLNKKASKAKILHVDAKPGEHYFAKLKGFPPWPVIIAEEDMLPQSMLSSRPVTAARPDGTYREDFADGGKRVADRTFPVMYLHTNEFSWTNNTDLSELDPSTVASMITTKMRKDLQNAHLLAAEQYDLDYYKNVLREFEEQRLAKIEAKRNKKSKKATKAVETTAADEDEDIEMPDADIEEPEEAEPAEKKPKSKKRKADDETNTPQRADSVKKPKFKLTNSGTPKASNGVQSPTPKESAKGVKVKAKPAKSGKEKAEPKKEKEASVVPKEPELTPEERHVRKEKEILFLRHRLQKGLLLRDQEPKEEEMKSMSEFLGKLETFPDLEVSIIRATKINKVLKAILKLETIPKEDEYTFKPRSQTLLDKWNKLLATTETTPAANGVNGASDAGKGGKAAANGVKESSADHKDDAEDSKAEKESKAEAESKTGDEEMADSAKVSHYAQYWVEYKTRYSSTLPQSQSQNTNYS